MTRRWSRPDRQVAALTVVLGVAALVFDGALLASSDRPLVDGPGPLLWALALLMMFVLTEGFAIHVRVRRGGHAMSITEIPMVIGLTLLNPLVVVLARTVGAAAGLALLRHQRGRKLAFNIAQISLQATVGAAVFGILADPASGMNGPRDWLAAYAGMLAADVVAIIVLTAVISLHDDPSEWRRLPSAMRGLGLVLIATSIALISAIAIQSSPYAVAVLAVLYAVVHVAYRGYVRQSLGNEQVENLYAFTSALDSSLETGRLTRVVLEQVRDELRASDVELVLPPDATRAGRRVRLSGQGQFDETGIGEPAPDTGWAPARHGDLILLPAGPSRPDGPADAMAVPVPLGGEVPGVLLVIDSLPDITTFTADHLRLLQAMANHAGVALANARLVDRLRSEAVEKEQLSLHDSLTGLPNRVLLYRLLDAALADQPDAATVTAVLLIDLDRFKEINDGLGHDVGDALLRIVGERLRDRLTGRGTVARLGGDEFAVLLQVPSAADATAVGHDIARDLEHPVSVGHLALHARASIGIVVAPEHGRDSGTLLRRADVAMYSAKQARAGVRVYRESDDRNTPQRLALIGDLSRAVEDEQTQVVFQPKVDPATGAVVGAEALSRWNHPEHGVIGPDLFVPLAEHSGLIRPLTLYVLKVALRNCAVWRRIGHDLHVAVNLSPNTLSDDTLPDVITRLLAENEVPATALTLEITEGTLMADPDGGLVTLDRLRRLGVKISIDDFGTGYSSLGRLRDLPIDEVKIDKSFVRKAAHDHRDQALTRSIVQLGHALGLHVVAEGVEDEATCRHLAGIGCDTVQGYHISRPLPEDEFTAWLRGTPATTGTLAVTGA